MVSSLASSGKASSTSFILSTGLNTCSAAKRSGRPLAAASSATESDEVVVASSALGGKQLAEPAVQVALHRRVLGHGLDHDVAAGELLEVGRPPRALPSFSAARSAERSLRAQTTTSWCSAAARARPHAMAPLPTIPS